jgi:hypothetical protein
MLMRTDIRTPVRVRIRPSTKQLLAEKAAAAGMSVTALIERAVQHWDAQALARIKPELHQSYRDGTLSFVEAFGRDPKPRKLGAARRVNLSVDLRIEAYEALLRVEKLSGYSRPLLLGTLAKRPWRGPPPPAEPMPEPLPMPSEPVHEPAMDPELALQLEPEPEPEPVAA